jgi:Fe-S-cluster containining protein
VDIHFDCTQCGRCCHDLKLPLSVEEAIRWAGKGHQVQILVDASPAFEEPAEDAPERYLYDRSFPAMSGTVPIRVSVLFVAAFEGACPHLRPDMLCGNYEERPRVCRIYPAEVSPRAQLIPAQKACPPEAWFEDQPLLSRDGGVVDGELASLIEAHRLATLADVEARSSACLDLGIASAAFANEGYAVHSPDPARLVGILTADRSQDIPHDGSRQWDIVTNRGVTLALLGSVGARSLLVGKGDSYLGFFDDAA